MPASQSDLLQGTLDLLILKALTLQELHGMGVSRRSLAGHSTSKRDPCFPPCTAWNRPVGSHLSGANQKPIGARSSTR